MKYKVSDTDLTSVANAIRTKGGTSAGLSFPDGFVSAIGNIPTGGGSTLISKSITANGTYNASSDNADGYSSVTVAVPTKLVTGTFTGQDSDKGSAINISIPYTGNGYPIAGIIYPSHGTMKTGDSFSELVQQYAEVMWAFAKNDIGTAPTYNDTSAEANKCSMLAYYKYSTSDPLNYTTGGQKDIAVFQSSTARATYGNCARIHSSTSMSAYIADSSYGFAAGIEYTYQLIYSS